MEILQDQNPARAERVMKAVMQMKKLDISGLQPAYGQD
jgi:hypothetical protein